MSWREKTVIRILLIIARMFVADGATGEELKHLASHINVWTPEVK